MWSESDKQLMLGISTSLGCFYDFNIVSTQTFQVLPPSGGSGCLSCCGTDSSLVRSHFLCRPTLGSLRWRMEPLPPPPLQRWLGTRLTAQFFILIGGDTSKVAEWEREWEVCSSDWAVRWGRRAATSCFEQVPLASSPPLFSAKTMQFPGYHQGGEVRQWS